MCNKTALKAAFTIKTIEGRIQGLAARLYKLAPHPTRPDHSGPLFISLASNFKPAAEYDGMLGNLMLEGFLGTAFTGAANDNVVSTTAQIGGFDAMVEGLSEYLEYSAKKKDAEQKGQGTFALGEHKTICNKFDTDDRDKWQSFRADLQEREATEGAITGLCRTLDAIKSQRPEILHA